MDTGRIKVIVKTHLDQINKYLQHLGGIFAVSLELPQVEYSEEQPKQTFGTLDDESIIRKIKQIIDKEDLSKYSCEFTWIYGCTKNIISNSDDTAKEKVDRLIGEPEPFDWLVRAAFCQCGESEENNRCPINTFAKEVLKVLGQRITEENILAEYKNDKITFFYNAFADTDPYDRVIATLAHEFFHHYQHHLALQCFPDGYDECTVNGLMTRAIKESTAEVFSYLYCNSISLSQQCTLMKEEWRTSFYFATPYSKGYYLVERNNPYQCLEKVIKESCIDVNNGFNLLVENRFSYDKSYINHETCDIELGKDGSSQVVGNVLGKSLFGKTPYFFLVNKHLGIEAWNIAKGNKNNEFLTKMIEEITRKSIGDGSISESGTLHLFAQFRELDNNWYIYCGAWSIDFKSIQKIKFISDSFARKIIVQKKTLTSDYIVYDSNEFDKNIKEVICSNNVDKTEIREHYEKQLSEKEGALKTLNSTLSELRKEKEVNETQIQALDQRIMKLQRQLQTARKDLDGYSRLNDECAKLRSNITILRERVLEVQRERNSLESFAARNHDFTTQFALLTDKIQQIIISSKEKKIKVLSNQVQCANKVDQIAENTWNDLFIQVIKDSMQAGSEKDCSVEIQFKDCTKFETKITKDVLNRFSEYEAVKHFLA